jgi:hypothetical protein
MSQRRGCLVRPLITILPVAFMSSFLWATPASGARKAAVPARQAQERAARKACLSGDYARGVTILSELFVDTKDPTYIFNQGRCFEQNHRYEDAISRFEEYLRVPDANLDAADRAVAEKRIADCKDRLPESSRVLGSSPQPFVPPPPPPTPAAPPEPPSAPESSTSIATQSRPHPTATKSGSGLRVAGIVIGSVGVAAAAAGVLLNLKANSISTEMGTTVGNYETRGSNRKTYETMAWVGYGVGAACLVTGVILYAVGARTGGKSSTRVALLPAIGPGQAGALLTGGF